jgi:hypothetical protein
MARTAAKPKLKTFHATMVVTRTEEWCVEAETAEGRCSPPGKAIAARSATGCTSRSRRSTMRHSFGGPPLGGEGGRLILAAAPPGRYIHPQIAA